MRRMDTIRAKEDLAPSLASQNASTLEQALLELAEDHALVAEYLDRMRLRGAPATLTAAFAERLKRWNADRRYIRQSVTQSKARR